MESDSKRQHSLPWDPINPYQEPYPQSDTIHTGLMMTVLCKFNKEPTTINSFKLLRAEACRTLKPKRKSWQNYINQLNASIKKNTIWKMIRKISGKTSLTHKAEN